jgi:glyoxylase-like metal-dependent hydrolase (beta-lactamase superfamily II)
MAASPTFSGPPPTADFNASPTIHNIYSKSTETWQYVVADPTTGHCIVLDPVRDRCSDEAAMSTKAADAIVDLVEQHSYVVDYILETHASGSQCLSAAWYLRMQFSIYQGWPPQLCNEATVSGLEVQWQRKYGAGSTFSTTIRAGLRDGEKVTLGWLSLTSLHMPGFGSPHRRAYLVGKDLFGAHSIATLADNVFDEGVHNSESTPSVPEDTVSFLDAWTSMQRILKLPSDTRVWWDTGVVSGDALPCNSLSQCTTANKHAKSSEPDFLADMRGRYVRRLGMAAQATPKPVGWKERLGSLFSAA